MNWYCKKQFVLFLILLLNLLGYAQTKFPIEHYTISDGLSQSSVSCIVEDEENQLWLGTQEGLNRFDGKNFEVYNRENTPAIINDYIFCGIKGEQGLLWFGTRNGLLQFNMETAQFRSIPVHNNKSISIKQIVQKNKNELVVLTTQNEVLFFSIAKQQFQRHAGVSKALKLVQTEESIFLVGINNEIHELLLNNSWKHSYTHSAAIQNVFYCNGSLFIFSNNGVSELRVNQATKKARPVFKEVSLGTLDGVTGMVFYKNNYFLSTNQSGLYVLTDNRITSQIKANLFDAESLKSNNINISHLSKENVLWLGSDHGLTGLLIEGSGFNTYRPSANYEQGLMSENVWSFLKYGENILIGTDQGVSSLNMLSGTFQHYPRQNTTQSSDGSVMDIESVNQKSQLLACYDGVFLFTQNAIEKFIAIEIKDQKIKEKHKHFYQLLKYDNDYIIGTSAGLLLLDINTRQFQEIYLPWKDQVRQISMDAQGKIWVLFENKGLFQFKRMKDKYSAVPFNHNKYLLSATADPLTCFVTSDDGSFFIGTMGSGIIRINANNGAIKCVRKKDGLPNNTINALVLDQWGNIWCTTNRGLCCLKNSGSMNSMHSTSGLEPNEYNMNSAYFDEKGKIYFGGVFGFINFDPIAVLKPNKNLFPKVVQVSFHKKNKRYNASFIRETRLKQLAYQIELPYNARDFEINVQPSQLFGASHVTYKYVIIGEETDTIYMGNTSNIPFSALAAGTYYLRIYSRYNQGSWTNTPALLTVVINPPFWVTLPFWLSIGLFLILVTFAYVRFQITRERQQRLILEDLVQSRTKEIQEQKDQIQRKNELISVEKEKVIEQQKLLYLEKERAEKWLNNALPVQAVTELKVHGKVKAKAYDTATILFTDVVGFSKISEKITPSRLVNKLDVLFRKFDQIIHDNNLEKIKTIGDAYMAVAGVPDENTTHAIDACLAGLQIQAYMNAKKFDAIANLKEYWEIRVGINSGPVTAGIIGSLKMAYDVWGSAVNQAQRMEMLGQPGTVTISANTFKLIEPYFECEHKGKAQMKSKVLLDMYEVRRIKPELSLDGQGLKPNDLFYEIVGLHLYSSIKYYNAENELIQLLSERLPKDLYYHSLEHTKEVVKAVERIALLEGVRDEGLFLLKSAALFHDAGFIEQYEHNEPIGAALAEKMLPKYGYNEQHIKTIKELIYVTQIPHKPVTKLQEIMCDADLDYLGTEAFDEISDKLKRELMAKGKVQSDKEWDTIQIPFLKQHHYFTKTAKLSREKLKQEQIKKIEARLLGDQYD